MSDDLNFDNGQAAREELRQDLWSRKQDDREELRWSLEAEYDAKGGDDTKHDWPDDEDKSLKADILRSFGENEDEQHERAMKEKRRADLDEIDQYAQSRYGMSAKDAFAQLDTAHGMLTRDPRTFLEKHVKPIMENPAGYNSQFDEPRQRHVAEVVANFADRKGIRKGSAIERHMTAIVKDPGFKRTNNIEKDLAAAYRIATQRVNAA